jgi:hypothetical protein
MGDRSVCWFTRPAENLAVRKSAPTSPGKRGEVLTSGTAMWEYDSPQAGEGVQLPAVHVVKNLTQCSMT